MGNGVLANSETGIGREAYTPLFLGSWEARRDLCAEVTTVLPRELGETSAQRLLLSLGS